MFGTKRVTARPGIFIVSVPGGTRCQREVGSNPKPDGNCALFAYDFWCSANSSAQESFARIPPAVCDRPNQVGLPENLSPPAQGDHIVLTEREKAVAQLDSP
jgi:hypothetical protein